MTKKCLKGLITLFQKTVIELYVLSTHVYLLAMYVHVCFGNKLAVSVNLN